MIFDPLRDKKRLCRTLFSWALKNWYDFGKRREGRKNVAGETSITTGGAGRCTADREWTCAEEEEGRGTLQRTDDQSQTGPRLEWEAARTSVIVPD